MKTHNIRYSETRELAIESLLPLYQANEWSSAEKPELLHKALLASRSLVTAWDDTKLVGLGNAISDGYLVVYDHEKAHAHRHRPVGGRSMHGFLEADMNGIAGP